MGAGQNAFLDRVVGVERRLGDVALVVAREPGQAAIARVHVGELDASARNAPEDAAVRPDLDAPGAVVHGQRPVVDGRADARGENAGAEGREHDEQGGNAPHESSIDRRSEPRVSEL